MCPFLAVVGVLTLIGGGAGLMIFWTFAAHHTFWTMPQEIDYWKQDYRHLRDNRVRALEDKVEHLISKLGVV